jgi:hypothetical protein
MSRVDDLNDDCFSLATDLVAKLCGEFEAAIGDKPTIDELCELLFWGIRSCGADILRDINVENLVELKAKVVKRQKVRPRPGDVIAVPAGKGDCFLLVYLGRFGRFGHAFGILDGRFKRKPLGPRLQPGVVAQPIFTGLEAIASGRWSIVAHRPEWLKLFREQPEYYYAHEPVQPDEEDPIGPYGDAETETGVVRHLTEREAREIDLLGRDFFQEGLEDEVERYLQRLLRGSHRRPKAASKRRRTKR